MGPRDNVYKKRNRQVRLHRPNERGFSDTHSTSVDNLPF